MNVAARPRTVVDSNNLVSGVIVPAGSSGRLIRAWPEDAFVLLTSEAHRREMTIALNQDKIRQRPGLERDRLSDVLLGLRARADHVAPLPMDALPIRCRDPKDDLILACALGGQADYLVTGDEDLLVLDGDERLGHLHIVRVVDFLDRLAHGS